jgi:hypothetical protein
LKNFVNGSKRTTTHTEKFFVALIKHCSRGQKRELIQI